MGTGPRDQQRGVVRAVSMARRRRRLVALLMVTALLGVGVGRQSELERELQRRQAREQPALGAGGRPARLGGDLQRRGHRALRLWGVDTELSDRVPLHRTIREVRHQQCLNVSYDSSCSEQRLPPATVVIAHHNEPLSLLLRTVSSVLRDARRYSCGGAEYGVLKELLLVDDGGDQRGAELLRHYVETRLPPLVRTLRLERRRGVVGARVAGARVATGHVLVFLDAQCEVAADWLRPLLARVHHRPRAVAVPVIDVINATTLEYHTLPNLDYYVGGFLFSGQFVWSEVQPADRQSPVEPVRSPVMVGGVYAMWRGYFWQLGGYDEHMTLWGGENLEMSFRVWQCGGEIEVVPCSRVGHVVMAFHAQLRDELTVQAVNAARAADVWMDDYNELFYLHHPELRHQRQPGLLERRALRRRLRCHSFQWYLTNVYPHKFVPIRDDVAYGRFENVLGVCLRGASSEGGALCGGGCHPPTLMHLSVRHQLRDEMRCAVPQTTADGGTMAVMMECDDQPQQRWRWLRRTRQLQHVSSGLCLHSAAPHVAALLVRCRAADGAQQWTLQYGTHNNFITNASAPTPLELRLRRLRIKWRAAMISTQS